MIEFPCKSGPPFATNLTGFPQVCASMQENVFFMRKSIFHSVFSRQFSCKFQSSQSSLVPSWCCCAAVTLLMPVRRSQRCRTSRTFCGSRSKTGVRTCPAMGQKGFKRRMWTSLRPRGFATKLRSRPRPFARHPDRR